MKGYDLLGFARFLTSCLVELYPSWYPFQPIKRTLPERQRTATDKIGQIKKTFVRWLTLFTPQDERKMNSFRFSACRFALFWKVCPRTNVRICLSRTYRTNVRIPPRKSYPHLADSYPQGLGFLIIRHARPRCGLSTEVIHRSE